MGQAECLKIAERTATWGRETPGAAAGVAGGWIRPNGSAAGSWRRRAEGVPIRALVAAAGLSSSRVRQIATAADLDELDAALGELGLRAGRPRKTPMVVMMTRNWTAAR
ncbi:MAG TPA: hypothetical protein VGS06_26215 [Streptosporangiaceae bacterium]|nr:hypothetical protein [Streptosporangiaceae bacterium]